MADDAGGDPPPGGAQLGVDERAATADERGTLDAFLEFYRGIVVKKVAGLSDEDARRRLVPSSTTAGGIVKHLRWVEDGWSPSCSRGVPATIVGRTIATGSSGSSPARRSSS